MGIAVVLAFASALAVAGPAQATEWGNVQGYFYTPVSGVDQVVTDAWEIRIYSTHSSYAVPVGQYGGGQFAVQVPAGDYKMSFKQIHVPEDAYLTWSGDTPDESAAEIIHVDPNAIVNYDVHAPAAGSISGTVNFIGGATNGAYVSAYRLSPSGSRFTVYREQSADADGSYSLAGLAAGSYLVRFTGQQDGLPASVEYWNASNYILDSQLQAVAAGDAVSNIDGTIGPGGVYIGRIGGADRFAVSVNLSSGFAPNVPAAFVVNGLNFPDALSAGAAAAHLGGPVLLTSPTSLPASVASELTRLSPQHIYIVGGPNSVSADVATQLEAFAPAGQVTRISGADRYEASRNVASQLFSAAGVVYLANGANFPDALAAGPAASGEAAPVVLVNGSQQSIDEATATLFQSLGTKKIIIAGGPASVSQGLEDSLATIPGVQEVYRRTGSDRYGAAESINNAGFDLADTMFLSTGVKFPDALSAGPVAGSLLAPIALVHPDCIPSAVLDEMLSLHVRDVWILGGEATLNSDVENLVVCSS